MQQWQHIHINILETRSRRLHLQHASVAHQETRFVCGRDSTVTLGAGRKGRSSSRALNAELRRTMAHVIGGDLYTADFFVDTRRNPADHPPRRCGERARAWLRGGGRRNRIWRTCRWVRT